MVELYISLQNISEGPGGCGIPTFVLFCCLIFCLIFVSMGVLFVVLLGGWFNGESSAVGRLMVMMMCSVSDVGTSSCIDLLMNCHSDREFVVVVPVKRERKSRREQRQTTRTWIE